MSDNASKSALGNKRVYDSDSVAGHYTGLAELFPAERAILAQLEKDLPRLRMLDLGVGGGRTTLHFAHRVKRYEGADYSAAMIDGCRKRFPTPPPNVAFSVADARELSAWPDASFDFILFSYNGLDYIGHEERQRALKELKRVASPGAWICFSSHNLMSLGIERPSPAGSGASPFSGAALRATMRRWLLRILNGNLAKLKQGDHAIIHDDGCRFRLRTYYVRPVKQVRMLQEMGLAEVRVLDGNGKEWATRDFLDEVTDEWVYYLARIPYPRPQ